MAKELRTVLSEEKGVFTILNYKKLDVKCRRNKIGRKSERLLFLVMEYWFLTNFNAPGADAEHNVMYPHRAI